MERTITRAKTCQVFLKKTWQVKKEHLKTDETLKRLLVPVLHQKKNH